MVTVHYYHLPSSLFNQQLVLYHFNLYITRAAFVGTLTHDEKAGCFTSPKRRERDNHIRDLLLALTRVVGKVQKNRGTGAKITMGANERTREEEAVEAFKRGTTPALLIGLYAVSPIKNISMVLK